MTDPQMVTIGLATIVLLAGLLFNNLRINDVKELLRSEIRAAQAETNERLTRYQAETNARFDRIDAKLETILKLMADMDERITRLEERSK